LHMIPSKKIDSDFRRSCATVLSQRHLVTGYEKGQPFL
jgi:hypothetical protein